MLSKGLLCTKKISSGNAAVKGIRDLHDVILALLNTDGTLYVDLKKDRMEYVQKIED